MNRLFLLLAAAILPFIAVMPQSLSERLDVLLADDIITQCDASVMVCDLDTDSMLYSHRANKLTRPASLLKVITSAAAVERLGSDYTIGTMLLQSGNNLYIKGALDPLFTYEDMQYLLQAVPQNVNVDTLFADCSFMDSIYWGPGWAWDDTPWKFQPYISPLMLCGGCVEVKARPSFKGEAPLVECYPPSAFYSVANEAVSRAGNGEKFTILRDWLAGTNTIRLRGDCRSAKSEKMNMFPSQDFFITVAAEVLAGRGITVNNIASRETPLSCDTLRVVNRPLCDVVCEALKESDNLCAEALSYHLGALYGRTPVKQEMGPKIVKGYLEYTLDMPEVYDIRDGSGLSPYTLIPADVVMQLLRHIYSTPALYELFMRGLPQSGVSGSLKNRTKGTAAYKQVFAKTGALTGVCNLAGYAKAANGHTLAFVILTDGYPKARAVRAWQDKVCEAICK